MGAEAGEAGNAISCFSSPCLLIIKFLNRNNDNSNKHFLTMCQIVLYMLVHLWIDFKSD